MINIFKNLFKEKIGNPPWDYYFLKTLSESDYPKYLAKLFKIKTGENLPLLKEWNFKSGEWNYKINKKKLKTFNQKIQWIKLYGITPLMRDCTDKVKVRDYVAEKIGSEYLKPALQIVRNEELEVRSNNSISNFSMLTPNLFDKIDFEKLPDSFVIKCNHGCKWHFIIKNKEEYLKNKRLVDITRRNITGWLEQEFWIWGGFELNYREIKPKILIEPLLRDEINTVPREIEVYCFNSQPKIFVNVKYKHKREICYYDENFNFIDLLLHPDGNNEIIKENADDLLYRGSDLSSRLSKDFPFVRVDWLIYHNKLYFNELTFTPYSGFIKFDKNWNLKLGSWIDLEKERA